MSLTDMQPTVTVDNGEKLSVYKIDETSLMYNLAVQQLMAYTMSQDARDLPPGTALVILLPNSIKKKFHKMFMKHDTKFTFVMSNSWKYVLETKKCLESGWYFNENKVKEEKFSI